MKEKKKISLISIIVSIILWITGCGKTTQNTVKSESIRTDITAIEYAKDMGIGINLGNTMEAFWEDKNNHTSGCMTIGENTPQDYETCWGAVVTTQEIIDGYKEAGFNTVRIPVYWGNMMENDGTYTINDDYFERVDEIIEYCIEDDMYVVINIHHYDEFLIKNHERDEVLEIAKHLWTQISNHYKGYSNYLVFEGYNENLGSQREEDSFTDDELYDYVNAMNQTFVDAVRNTGSNNTNRLLIISGYWTNTEKTTDARFIMPEDTVKDKMMVSVHYIDNAKYWMNQVGNQAWMDYSIDQCELLKAAFTDKKIPVFIGECTSIYENDHFAANAIYTDSSKCLSLMLHMTVEYGFVPVLWDVNDNMYSRTEYKLKSESDQLVITEIFK